LVNLIDDGATCNNMGTDSSRNAFLCPAIATAKIWVIDIPEGRNMKNTFLINL